MYYPGDYFYSCEKGMFPSKLFARLKDLPPISQNALNKLQEFKDSMSSEVSKRMDDVKKKVKPLERIQKFRDTANPSEFLSRRMDDVKRFVQPRPLPKAEYRETDDVVFVSETADAHSDDALQKKYYQKVTDDAIEEIQDGAVEEGLSEEQWAYEQRKLNDISKTQTILAKRIDTEMERRAEFDRKQEYYQESIRRYRNDVEGVEDESQQFLYLRGLNNTRDRAEREKREEIQRRQNWEEEHERFLTEVKKEVRLLDDGIPLVPGTDYTYSEIDCMIDVLNDRSIQLVIAMVNGTYYSVWYDAIKIELEDYGYQDVDPLLSTVIQRFPMNYGPYYPLSEIEREEIDRIGIPPEFWKALKRRDERKRISTLLKE